MLRGLLHDDAEERWTLDDLLAWFSIGRVNPAQARHAPRASRAFPFAGGRYLTARTLAQAMAGNWSEAVKIAKASALANWVERSLKSESVSKALADTAAVPRGGSRKIDDDTLLTRTLIALDPDVAIRCRGFAVMPDGLGPALVAALDDPDRLKLFRELVSNQIFSFWIERQTKVQPWMYGVQEITNRLAGFLARPSAGFGVERCLYELNPGLACQSEQFATVAATTPGDLLRAMDVVAANGGDIEIDRHIAAFFAARLSGNLDRELREMTAGAEPAHAIIGQLKLLGYVQTKTGPLEVNALAHYYLAAIGPILAKIHSANLRQRILRAVAKAAEAGRLIEMVTVLDDARSKRWDENTLRAGRRQYAAAEHELAALERAAVRRARDAQALGHRAAAYLASLLAALALATVMVGVVT